MGIATSESFSEAPGGEPRNLTALLLKSIALRHQIVVLERGAPASLPRFRARGLGFEEPQQKSSHLNRTADNGRSPERSRQFSSLRRSRYGFESDGDRFALFARCEKTAPSVGASEETYPHVGYAVFLSQQLMHLRVRVGIG
jgi:hypothetical protein